MDDEGAKPGRPKGREMAAKSAAEAVPDPGRRLSEEAKVRTEAALTAEIGFVERLVWFWSNHFCVSADEIRACPAPMSARPSAPTCSAGSPTCCWPSRAIRRCCSISTMPVRWARTRSPASIATVASTRISPARSWSCIRWACAPATPRTTSSASPR